MKSPAADTEYLSFIAHSTAAGVEVGVVQEVFEAHAITRVPGCNECVVGIVNIRGNVVPVLDLFEAYDRDSTVKKIVVLKTSEGLVGVIITVLNDLVRFERIEPCGDVPMPLVKMGDICTGVGMYANHRIYVLNVEAAIRSTLSNAPREGMPV